MSVTDRETTDNSRTIGLYVTLGYNCASKQAICKTLPETDAMILNNE